MPVQKPKSAKKVKEEGTQEFFDKSRKNASFTFSSAPVNKSVAKQQFQESHKNGIENGQGKKRSAFVAKLYKDEDDLQELKMLAGGEQNFDSDIEIDEAGGSDSDLQGEIRKKRQDKQSQKGESKAFTGLSKKPAEALSKIGRLKFEKGSLGLFGVSEVVADKYAIVNHTRNVKGYINLKEMGSQQVKLSVGQLVVAAVTQLGTTDYNEKTSRNKNRKLQLSLDPGLINRGLSKEAVTPGMFLQGLVQSVESKGYMINLGFKDQSTGFVKFAQNDKKGTQYAVGSLIQVFVESKTSKVLKCVPVDETSAQTSVQTSLSAVSLHTLKPGFLVKGKVAKLFDNGLQMTFLGGLTGTVFIDHVNSNSSLKGLKVASKVTARVITADPALKSASLSLLPHLISLQTGKSDPKEANSELTGQIFTNVTVEKKLFGQSYLVNLSEGSTILKGFLHKSNIPREGAEEEETKVNEADSDAEKEVKLNPEEAKAIMDDEKQKLRKNNKGKKGKNKAKQLGESKDDLLSDGQVLQKVRVKEFNFFDLMPILSLKEDLISGGSLDYASLELGSTHQAIIESINETKKEVILRLNDFVKGVLSIQHMADNPLKVIPPKFKKVGKETKVRVFSKDGRSVVFTKKESLLKDDVPVVTKPTDLKTGDKFLGVLVSQTEHGYLLRGLGGVKGLLSNADAKENVSKLKAFDLKAGALLKTYVLFVKKATGSVALTLSKSKIEKVAAQEEASVESLEEMYFPSGEAATKIRENYSKELKSAQLQTKVGTVHSFKVCESQENYYVVKQIESRGQAKKAIAILPKCLSTSFGISVSFENPDFTFKALVVANIEGLPLVAAKAELIALKDEFCLENSKKQTSKVGIVNSISQKKGIQIRFNDNKFVQVAIKDLQTTQDLGKAYPIGTVVRAAENKNGRLCLKQIVTESADHESIQRDLLTCAQSFGNFSSQAIATIPQVKIGQKVTAKVQLVKDYGLILALEDIVDQDGQKLTGFIVNEQKKSAKSAKPGQILSCVVLDIDAQKKIVDLSERLADREENKVSTTQSKTSKKEFQKAIVELNKDGYLVVTPKSDRSRVGVCLQSGYLTLDKTAYAQKYMRFVVGDEIEVKAIAQHVEGGHHLFIPKVTQAAKANSLSKSTSQNVEEGFTVKGQIVSKKGNCVFIQLGMTGKMPLIGRLQRVETPQNEFDQFKAGDRISAKVLRKVVESDKTLIELTCNKRHLKESEGKLNEELLKQMSLETLREGQSVEAIVIDVAPEDSSLKVSCPVQVQVSPFVRQQILFSDLILPSQLVDKPVGYAQTLLQTEFKVGQPVNLTFQNNKFVSAGAVKRNATDLPEVGELLVVRFVKAKHGFGITVQCSEKIFGSIAMCEITDEITQNVCFEAQKWGIFLARVIDHDKNGRVLLSSRESILDDKVWALVQPAGPTGKFQQIDSTRQDQGDKRNKILKFGVGLALKEGDLIRGYVANVSKAGCFLQIGHGVSVRAGLNELSDESNFNFQTQFPKGRIALGRVTRVHPETGRLDCSFRHSLVLYGVHSLRRSDLKPSSSVECLILATSADGVAFAQVKGTYLKLKLKGTPSNCRPGQLCNAVISKVQPDKIVADFENFDVNTAQGADREREVLLQALWASVEEEAKHDIRNASSIVEDEAKNAKKGAEPDLETLIAKRREVTELEEQIRDLQELDQNQQQKSEDDDSDEEMPLDDSDAEEMARLQKEAEADESESSDQKDAEEVKEYEDSEEDQEMSDMEDLDESGEEEQEEESSEEDMSRKKSGKKALRQQLDAEIEIRNKEKEMRSKDGVAPRSVNDFERMLVANKDQSYVWIQYLAFMLENLDVEAARRVAERAVKAVSMTAEDDKLNLWIAFMNLEGRFGSVESLQKVVQRALDVNDRKKIYLQLVNVYKGMEKFDLVEDIFKKLCKKYFSEPEIWANYLEFLFEMRQISSTDSTSFTEPKTVLQRSLQALPKASHVTIISKFGMLEFKNGSPETGRTMLEGIVTNYPKRMDIWSIYMDMEVKYGGGKKNESQTRHLFERCLGQSEIQNKPKKMKLVFRKYLEFETSMNNTARVDQLRDRVEKYIEETFKAEKGSDSENNDSQSNEKSDAEMSDASSL